MIWDVLWNIEFRDKIADVEGKLKKKKNLCALPFFQMLASPSPSSSGQLSQLGASLYGPQSKYIDLIEEDDYCFCF